ncbi:hypothetical protein B0T36_22200 [Nocardia donostiensis]|nr:hypothetical protein B0T36_22200 [Nocardia donostiensis]
MRKSAFAAVGFAEFSGEIGVCAATGGPRAVHLLNELYYAELDPGTHGARGCRPAGSRSACCVQRCVRGVCAAVRGPPAAAERAGPRDPGRAGRAPDGGDRACRRISSRVPTARAREEERAVEPGGSTGIPPCRGPAGVALHGGDPQRW